ncbi:DNA topoisomerase 2-alpha, partial [Frankliniella fusca]
MDRFLPVVRLLYTNGNLECVSCALISPDLPEPYGARQPGYLPVAIRRTAPRVQHSSARVFSTTHGDTPFPASPRGQSVCLPARGEPVKPRRATPEATPRPFRPDDPFGSTRYT